MAKYLLYRRYWQRLLEQQRRRALGVRTYWAAGPTGLAPNDYWIDLPSTIPEKMVFMELARRKIGFQFGYYWGDMPYSTDVQERFRPDFMLPDYKIIIEVFGIYWHTRAGMPEYDAQRTAYFLAAGWKIYALTDLDIMHDVGQAIDRAIPELVHATIMSGMTAWAIRPFDPSAAIAARTRKYPKVLRTRYISKVRKGVDETRAEWRAGTFARKWNQGAEPLFLPQMLHANAAEYLKWDIEWQNYIKGLHYYFFNINNGSGMDGEGYSRTYNEHALYLEYLRWRRWYLDMGNTLGLPGPDSWWPA